MNDNVTETTTPTSYVDTTVDPDSGDSVDTGASASVDEGASASGDGSYEVMIDGKKVAVSKDELLKGYQLSKASYNRMSEAAKLRKEVQDTYAQLKHYAENDPEGLLRALNPKWNSVSKQNTTQQTEESIPDSFRPYLTKMAEMEKTVTALRESLDQAAVEKERMAINKEYETITEQYPILKGKAQRAYLLNEYARALRNGIQGPNGEEITMEDVAFYVAQELSDGQQQVIQRVKEAKKTAPGGTKSAAPKKVTEDGYFKNMDDVKRLAGIPV